MRFSWIPILSLLPKNLLSQIFGRIARCKLPGFSTAFKNWFVKFYDIDMSDAEFSQAEYPTVSDLFVRALQPGARPLADQEIISPVDGLLSQAGTLDDVNLTMIQAKGKKYNLASLLRHDELAQKFAGGAYAVIYLAPYNYHRIHNPMSANLVASYYCPGNLWPVNADCVARIEGLFCINERATTHLQNPSGEMLLVKVGATNVGRISLDYPATWVTNSSSVPSRSQPLSTWLPPAPIALDAGTQLGKFELGSTVVLIVDKNIRAKYPELFSCKLNQAVKMGEGLCY